MGRIADAVVGDTSLREVVCPDFRTAVAGRHKRLAAVGNVIDIFLVLLVVDERTQARQGPFLVFRLVARLGSFDEYLLGLTSIGVLPHVAQTDTGLHLVHVLASGTT